MRSWARTDPASRRCPTFCPGKDGYEVTDGAATLGWCTDLLEIETGRARRGVGLFLAFQYPVEIPGVGNMTFLRTALNAQRKARGEEEDDQRR